MIWGLLALALAYLLGSVPVGLLVVRARRGRDIRKWYSGRTGATNVMRVAGYWAGLVTVLGDVGKATLAVAVARWLTGGHAGFVAAAGAAAVLGHNYSIFLLERGGGGYQLKGGAGGASAFGAAVGLWPPSGLILLPLAGAVYYGIGYASVTTMSVPLGAGVIFALRALRGVGPWEYIAFAIAVEALIIWALRPNIRRLLDGEERLVGWRASRRKSGKAEAGKEQGVD
ncbi:MAG TPA: glycerol-3-phosphate acyltransferase [Chloroflexi bacterium]|nr:glycerol-3-phosphate acyltransferase [Chloroflexota bacterium]